MPGTIPRICSVCGETRRIQGHGLCQRCYSRRKREDPDKAERDRAMSRDWKARNPEYLSGYGMEYGRTHRGTCIRCGGLMGIGVRGDGVCAKCRAVSVHEKRLMLASLWAQGRSMREIAAEFGWELHQVGPEMARMRKLGYNLPHRYNLGPL